MLASARLTIGCAVLLHARRPSALALAAARREHEAAGARRKVLVVSARARNVMSYDCAVTRMMNGGSRAHVVYTHAHTTTGAIYPCPRPERTNETEDDDRRSAIGDRRAASDERRPVRTGCPGRCTGAVPAGGVVCGFIFSGKNSISPNSKRTPQAAGARESELRTRARETRAPCRS